VDLPNLTEEDVDTLYALLCRANLPIALGRIAPALSRERFRFALEALCEGDLIRISVKQDALTIYAPLSPHRRCITVSRSADGM
jgi:hypothetical protein